MPAGVRRQAPLKVDPQVDELISQGAHFLGMTKKDLVAEAVREYLATRREEIHREMMETMKIFDGTSRSRLAGLIGVSPEDIDRIGGLKE